jgi:hypothetical protein
MFGDIERKIILSKIIPIDLAAKTGGFSTEIFFTIACDIIEVNKTLFLIDLGCRIIYALNHEYRVVARSSIELKNHETIDIPSLRTKVQEEIPELEKIINADIGKHENDFTISHEVKSSFTNTELEDAISDALRERLR